MGQNDAYIDHAWTKIINYIYDLMYYDVSLTEIVKGVVEIYMDRKRYDESEGY